MDEMTRLVEIMARLRGPDGCPWDREQTPDSLRTYVIEEAFELAEALDGGNWDEIRGELGDLLLQVVFLSRIAEEQGRFDVSDVARAIGDKLVRRHPHVFAAAEADSVEEVWKNWEQIKKTESGGRRSRIEGIPASLPGLVRAHRLAEKAARVGLDWPDSAAVLEKVDEELAEVRAALAAGSREDLEQEVGDLLFAVASFARREGVDPEAALSKAANTFSARFRKVEEAAEARGLVLEELEPDQVDALWQDAKRAGEST